LIPLMIEAEFTKAVVGEAYTCTACKDDLTWTKRDFEFKSYLEPVIVHWWTPYHLPS